jgi:hypothetical protein
MRAQFLGVIVVTAAILVGRVCAEEVGPKAAEKSGPKTGAAPAIKVTIACPKTTIVAGENLEFSVTIHNTSDKDVSTAPLQPFAFLTLHVESEGKVIPPGVKVLLSHVDPDVALNPGQTLKKDRDLCTWFPDGLYAGTLEVSAEYFPDRNDRNIVLRSNVVKLVVEARTAEQEKEYQDFVEMQRAGDDGAFIKCREFLKRHPKSMFEPRVRLWCAGYPDIIKDIDKIEELLGEAFERSSPTRTERTSARYLRARTLEGNGRFKEALSVLQDVDEPWAATRRRNLQYRVEHGPPTVKGEPEKEGSEQKGTGGWLLWTGLVLGLTLVLVVWVVVRRRRKPAAQKPNGTAC